MQEEMQPPLNYRNATWHYYSFPAAGEDRASLRRRGEGRPVHRPPVVTTPSQRRPDDDAGDVVTPRPPTPPVTEGSTACTELLPSHRFPRNRRVERGTAWMFFHLSKSYIWDVLQGRRRWIGTDGMPDLPRMLTSPRGATILLLVHGLLWILLIARLRYCWSHASAASD